MDRRSLGAFRVALGLVLFADLLRRWIEVSLWYTNSGLLPNHTLLWRPPANHLFSLFFTVSNPAEAHVAFALCALVYLLFIFGYRTRLMQVLALLVRVSLNSRLAVLENGGDMVMDLLCLLSLPLPLGSRFSLDALLSASDEKHVEISRRPVVSIAMLALLLQFATIYYFNAASKNGAAWRDGTAVHWALHQDKLVTGAGVWMREHLPLPLVRGLTWSTLLTEWTGFLLIITPFYVPQARLLAVCMMPLLHFGFAFGLNLGGFSPAMMSFYPLLLTAQHWDTLTRRAGPRLAPARERLEQWLRGLLARLRARPPALPSDRFRWLGEMTIALIMIAITFEVLNDNTPVPKPLRLPQPAWTKAVIEYPRILQGWRMFAPEPPKSDSMIYVDARTAAGAHVDPYNEVASNQPFPLGTVVPKHMGQSQYFVMYSERIPNVNYASYRQAFQEWLLAYPERTGRPEDCLLSYEVFLVTDQSPAPGAGLEPKPLDRQRFMVYHAPHDSTCKPLRADGPDKAVKKR